MARMQEYDQLQKMSLIGDPGVGKSRLLERFADGRFSSNTSCTIGVDFKIKHVVVDGQRIKLQLWDTAGTGRFRTGSPMYYRACDAALVVFDVSVRDSFEHVQSQWLEHVMEHAHEHVQVVLVGAKSDLDQRQVSPGEASAVAAKRGIPYFECSAKKGERCDLPFFCAAARVLQACRDGRLAPKTASTLDRPTAQRNKAAKTTCFC